MKEEFTELAKVLVQPIRRRAALKTFGIALGVIGLTLIMFTPVFGGNGSTSFRYIAKLLPVGDERHASGVVKLIVTHGTVSGSYRASVTCRGLTPGASYEFLGHNNVRDFALGIRVADTQGTLQFGFSGVYGDYQGYPARFELYRVQPIGNVLVLSGGI